MVTFYQRLSEYYSTIIFYILQYSGYTIMSQYYDSEYSDICDHIKKEIALNEMTKK